MQFRLQSLCGRSATSHALESVVHEQSRYIRHAATENEPSRDTGRPTITHFVITDVCIQLITDYDSCRPIDGDEQTVGSCCPQAAGLGRRWSPNPLRRLRAS
jgi:hypothetical protein